MDEKNLEEELKEKALAPRVTRGRIEKLIKDEAYYVFPGTTMTVCALTLENGFVVVGQAAAASTENFIESIGKQIARADARNKIWSLEAYLLKEKLYRGETI